MQAAKWGPPPYNFPPHRFPGNETIIPVPPPFPPTVPLNVVEEKLNITTKEALQMMIDDIKSILRKDGKYTFIEIEDIFNTILKKLQENYNVKD